MTNCIAKNNDETWCGDTEGRADWASTDPDRASCPDCIRAYVTAPFASLDTDPAALRAVRDYYARMWREAEATIDRVRTLADEWGREAWLHECAYELRAALDGQEDA